jgi:hypothetical protein
VTQDLFTTQQDILDKIKAEFGSDIVFDTDYPAPEYEPMEPDGIVLKTYMVVRFNDSVKNIRGGGFGGARYDELYTLVDVLVVGATPDRARSLAYGPDGVLDKMVGYTPVDAGEMNKHGGGQVFVASDGTGA